MLVTAITTRIQLKAPERRTINETSGPDETRRQRIRCPLCDWQPDGEPHWICELCFTQFDTFATRARCPSCPNSWRDTQCIACDRMSPHEDWYTEE